MQKQVNVGVLGGGRIGKIHAENLLYGLPAARLAAVADPFVDAVREWAERVGLPRLTADPADVIDDPDIDAVIICSPTDMHAEHIIACARAGKQILCEKPISFDVGKTREALEVVGETGVKLQIGFNRRFDSNAVRIRQAVSSGEIGDPHIVRITSRDPEPPPLAYVKVSGGIFVDMMIHDLDMARYVSGSEVTEVYAKGACLIDPEIGKAGDVDTAIVTLRFASGALGVIENSRSAGYGYDQRMEVFGSKGSIEADNRTESQVVVRNTDGVIGQKPLWFFIQRYKDAYLAEMRSFIDAIASGRDVSPTGEDGLRALVVALAATESQRSGQPVSYEEFARSFG